MKFFRRSKETTAQATKTALSKEEIDWLTVHRRILDRHGHQGAINVIAIELALAASKADEKGLEAGLQHVKKLTYLLLIPHYLERGLGELDAMLEANHRVNEVSARLEENMKLARVSPSFPSLMEVALASYL